MKKMFFLFISFTLSFSVSIPAGAALITPEKQTTSVPTAQEVKDALSSFLSLSKKEKKTRLREAKKVIREYKSAKRAGEDVDTNTLLLVILALILPPLAVYLHQGEANTKFWVTTLLFVLGLLGAFTLGWYLILASVIYALIVILGNN